MLSAYCSQDKLLEFPQPSIPVTQYITDVPEVAALAPCAFSALGYAVRAMVSWETGSLWTFSSTSAVTILI